MQKYSNGFSERLEKLTSYDLLKSFAVLLMIIDHIGYFFFPDEVWLRVIGRLCVPIWFFLIGYAKTREIPKRYWIAGVILQVFSFCGGIPILALNIIFSMIIIRLIIDRVMNYAMRDSKNLVIASFVIFVLAVPSYFLFEYGTEGLILAMLGYFVRNKGDTVSKDTINNFSIFAIFSFVAMQILFFEFSVSQIIILSAGVTCIVGFLTEFRAISCERLSISLPILIVSVFQFCGRKTLEIYVVHKIVFLFVAIWLGSNEQFGLFDFKLF